MIDPSSIYKSTDTPTRSSELGKRLIEQQSVFGTTTGALSAAVPIYILFAVTIRLENLIEYQLELQIAILLLSGFITAYVATFCGRGFEAKFALLTAATNAITGVIIHLWIIESLVTMALFIPSILISWYFGKRKLTQAEQRAIKRWQQIST